jgi:uncharacterized membrane protein
MIASLFRKKYFTKPEREAIVAAIRQAETATSGEVRIFIAKHNKMATALQSAVAVFHKLKMEQTAQRNAVLLYIAMESRQLAIYGDEGIHAIVGQDYWDGTITQLASHFKTGNMVQGIVEAVQDIGEKLQHHFPHLVGDKNELPDDIVFGK